MFARSKIWLFIPWLACAWDSPLPSLSGGALDTRGAFASPSASASAYAEVTGAAYGAADSSQSPWERQWSLFHMGSGHAESFRIWEGGAAAKARFDMSFARSWMGIAPGLKLAYDYSAVGEDGWVLEPALQWRPCPQFIAGYWGENLFASGPERAAQHWALGVKPAAASRRWFGRLLLGYEWMKVDGERRRDLAFADIPLPGGIDVQSRWDWKDRSGTVGIAVQATGAWSAAIARTGNRAVSKRAGYREIALARSARLETPFLLAPPRVAELDLNRSLAEGGTDKGWFSPGRGDLGFLDLLRRLDALDADPAARAVVIKLGHARCGWGMGEEIRDRILKLRGEGKRVVAYLDKVTPLNYYLASAADVVAAQPAGYFAVTGFSAEVTFYRGLFDKLGVEPQFLRHGKYKSFEEPYTRTGMSPEARSDLSGYLASLWDHYVETVAASRRLSRDSARAALESDAIGLEAARKRGLIDTLIQEDEALALAGGKHAARERIPPGGEARKNWDSPPKVAVVVVSGDMVLGRSSRGWLGAPDLAGAETVAEQLRKARGTPGVKAVILRVDSPGGSAQAADIMAREVELLRKDGIPVVASVGHMAASGGYYLICGADRILAEPNSTVGSIGVLWGKFVLKGLYAKLGVNSETVKTSPHADGNSMTRPWDSSEVTALQKHMDDFYGRFVGKVAAGRKMTETKADSLGQGRIFTGTQALDNGLIDAFGGLDGAVGEARRLAGIGPRREIDLVAIPPEGEGSHLLPGAEWARAQNALDQFQGWAEHYSALAEAQMWAISPELAGWDGGLLQVR
jgi:signal peptide peptidase SppA